MKIRILLPYTVFFLNTVPLFCSATDNVTAPAQNTTPVAKGSYFDTSNRSVLPANIDSPLKIVSDDKNALSLQECFRISAVRSDTLQITEQDIHAAQARMSQAIAQIFPTFNLVSSYNFQHSRTLSTGGSGSGSSSAASSSKSSGSREYSSTTGISMTQTLFNGFSNYNAVGAASADIQVHRYSLQRAYQTLYQGIAQAFYQILSNEGDIIILNDSVKALEARVKDLQERVHIGRSRPSELLQAKSDLASARVSIEETKGLLAAARELMSFYLGIPADKIRLRETQAFPSPGTMEKYLSEMGVRPDILAMVESERESRRNLSVAKGALFPQVTASGTYNLTSDPVTPQEWQVSFQIELPIFDGGLILSKIREQKALVCQSELNLENLRRTADQDVRTAFDNFNATVAQVVRLNEEVELAALSYNALSADYQAGIVANLDVLTAFNNLQSARRALNTADLNARLNLITLHVAAGLAPKSFEESKKDTVQTQIGNSQSQPEKKKANP